MSGFCGTLSAKPPRRRPYVQTIHTCSGHGDARASQRYTVFAAKTSAPDRFVQLAEVAYDAPDGGLHEAVIETVSRAALMDGVRGLRFVFSNGPLGFNVYREVAVFGEVQLAK